MGAGCCVGCGDPSCTLPRAPRDVVDSLHAHAFAYATGCGIERERSEAYASWYAGAYWDDENPRSHSSAFLEWERMAL